MKLDLGDYKIESDEKQFIVQAKSIIRESRLTKEENVGKEIFKIVAYLPTLPKCLNFIANKVVLDNDDINTIKDKLDSLHKEISKLNQVLEV
ncbi:hypothetical protein [Clostridium sardiniense]|uniref:hypothetical protein n=1 Tax=Clostridium sardiniense TaxID=29369 RepID=UPI001955F70B|nr:hypothetical protein [Clostridium sardiniense]MBM7835924.1 hypothetical protein [Clostridium sardiniense]